MEMVSSLVRVVSRVLPAVFFYDIQIIRSILN